MSQLHIKIVEFKRVHNSTGYGKRLLIAQVQNCIVLRTLKEVNRFLGNFFPVSQLFSQL